MQSLIGTTVSRYRIVGRVGAGGMGDIYLAEDTTLPRKVALKFLSERLMNDKRNVERFLREAQAASALEHPNICTIYEIGETEDGRSFIAMPYYDGKTIQALLAEGPMPLPHVVTYASAVADGLTKAHAKGILHRDIKPANLMVTPDRVVKILDFGLAKLTEEGPGTTTGVIMGTVPYMSPEQASGAPTNQQSDIFSLGTTLYEMTTGTNPFLAENPHAVIHRIKTENPIPPSTIRKEVPPALERIISRALERDPDRRYKKMADMRNDLHDVMRDLDSSTTVTLRPHPHFPEQKKRLILPLVAIMSMLALVLGAVNWDRLSESLGFGRLGDNKGIAVLALDPQSTDPSQQALATGIADQIASRVTQIANQDAKVWTIPPQRVRREGATTADDAQNVLGVDAYLTGSLVGPSDNPRWSIQLRAAQTGQQLYAFDLPTQYSESWNHELSVQLARALNIKADTLSITMGWTASSEAGRTYLEGLGTLASGDTARLTVASTAFDHALSMDPAFVDAHLGRASAWFARKETSDSLGWADEALTSCSTALDLDDSRPEAYALRGLVRAALGERSLAVEDFETALSLNDRDSYTWQQLGWTLFELERFEEAEETYKAAIKTNPAYWGGHEDLGFFYYLQGRLEEAVEQFQTVVRLVPDYSPTYNYLGAILYALDRWDESAVMFEKSFALGRNFEACANLGTLYYMQERFADAARMYEWAWEYDKSNYLTIGNFANAYLWIPEKRDEGRRLMEQAISLAEKQRNQAPEDALLLSHLAGFYSVDHPIEAEQTADRALELIPDDPEVLYRAALTYEQVGNRPRSLVLLASAIKHGYSLKAIAHERQLRELREDPRYQLLIAENTNRNP